MSQRPKYAVGDTVQVHDKHGIVVEVHEEQYFWAGREVYYEYSVRFDNGDVNKYAEKILDAPGQKPLLCECGLWAISWAAGQHSRWCPMYRAFERKE